MNLISICAGVLLTAGTAFGQTDLQVTANPINVSLNQGQSASYSLDLDVGAGSNAAHYSVIAVPDLAAPRFAHGAAPAIGDLSTVVRGEVDWDREHAADRLIVCFDDRGTVRDGARFVASDRTIAVRDGFHALHQGEARGRIGLANADIVEFPAGTDLRAVAAKYLALPGVTHVEPDYIVSIGDFPDDPYMPFGASSLGAPDDQRLWGLNTAATDGVSVRTDVRFDYDIDAREAWSITKGSDSVVVAVIDTGIDYNHPDLVDNMWINTGEIAGNGIDDDGNGYVDDVYGYDFINNDADPMDDHYHGTHCAGTVGAVGDNQQDVVGVAWNVKLMAMKFLGSGGSGPISAAAQCLEYAVANGAHLSNNSWGGGGFSQAMFTALQNADSAGHLFVAAAGNSSANTDNGTYLPQGYDVPNVVSVGSLQPAGGLSGFSNYGPASVDIAAPGSNVWSTNIGGGLRQLNGTSMATPHVAGVAALLKSVRPDATIEDLKSWIYGGATDKLELGAVIGNGRLNAWGALNEALTPWFSSDNREGIISSSDGTVTVDINLGTFKVAAGTYTGNLEILDLSYDTAATRVTTVPFSYTVNYVPAVPVAYDQSLLTGDNGTTLVTLQGEDPNPGDVVQFIITSLPANATLSDAGTGATISLVPFALSGDGVDFTPTLNGVDFTDTFTFVANDGTQDSATATVTIDVISAAVPPLNVQAGPAGTNRARVTWNPAPGATGYNVQYAEDEDGPFFISNSTPITGTEGFVTTPWEGDWWFRVSSVRDVVESDYSSPVEATLTDPYDNPVTATAGPDYIDITYKNGGSYSEGYLQRSTDKYGGWEFYGDICGGGGGQGGISVRDCNVTPGQTYYYRSVWYDLWDGFYYAYSAPAGATVGGPPLQQPQNPEIDFAGNRVLNMVWDSRQGVYGYAIYRATSFNGQYELVGIEQDSEYLDEDLVNYRTYFYQVAEIDSSNNAGPLSTKFWGTPYDANQAPPRPANAFFDEVVDDAITVEWDAIGSVQEYRVYRSVNGGAATLFATLGNGGYPFSITLEDDTVSMGNTYCYEIAAVSFSGLEGLRTTLCATAPDPGQTPAAPTGLFFDEITTNEATIEWDSVLGVQGYRVYRSDDGGTTYNTIAYVSSLNFPSYYDATLSPATSYCYYVTSVSYAQVESAASSIICGTTGGTPVNLPPIAVSDQYTVESGSTTVLNVLANDSDPEGDSLEIDEVTIEQGQGTVLLTDQNTTVTFIAPVGFVGETELEYTIIDEGNNDATAIILLQVVTPPNTEPTVTDDFATAFVNSFVEIDVLANDSDEDPGDVVSIESITQPSFGVAEIANGLVRYMPNTGFIGRDTMTYVGTDGTDSEVGNITIDVVSSLTMEWGTVTADGSFANVDTLNQYQDMVIVCVVERVNNTNPVVVRVNPVDSSSFEVRLQNPGDRDAVVADRVHYLVSEAGVFNESGVKFEAVKYTSTVTNRKNSWTGETRSYGQAYTSPVVIGQVMTSNDTGWSAFWSSANSQSSPPTASQFRTGKHVGEDSDTTRADETVAYFVFESGSGTIAGTPFEAILGADNVTGNPRTYAFGQTFAAAPIVVASQSAMDGGDGGFAVLPSAPGTSSGTFEVDEDQIRDSERNHTSEQVAYVAFGGAGSTAYTVGTAGVTGADPRDDVLAVDADFAASAVTADLGRTPAAKIDLGGSPLRVVSNRPVTVDLGGVALPSGNVSVELTADVPAGTALSVTLDGQKGTLARTTIRGNANGVQTYTLDLGASRARRFADSVTLTKLGAGNATIARISVLSGNVNAPALALTDGEPAPAVIIGVAPSLADFMENFALGNAEADLNADGAIDVVDIVELFEAIR